MKEGHRAIFTLLLAWVIVIAQLALLVVVWTRIEIPLWAKTVILFLIMIISPHWDDLTRLHQIKATEERALLSANNDQDATALCDDGKRDEEQ
jgi:hypothetical protein